MLGYRDAEHAVAVDLVLGVAIAALAGFRLRAGAAGRGVAVLLIWAGILRVMAPVVFRYGHVERAAPAYVNDVVVGLVVLIAGVLAARHERAAGPAR